jgi:pimeloyl-ACP methyl ester carboxylesterase
MEAYPATVERVREIDIPATMHVVDIVAERTWLDAPEDVSAIRRAHREFVAASPFREAVYARGSGHHVMRDRPDVVLDAVAKVVAAVRDGAPSPRGCSGLG